MWYIKNFAIVACINQIYTGKEIIISIRGVHVVEHWTHSVAGLAPEM